MVRVPKPGQDGVVTEEIEVDDINDIKLDGESEESEIDTEEIVEVKGANNEINDTQSDDMDSIPINVRYDQHSARDKLRQNL